MALSCELINTKRHQTLEDMSGVSGFLLDSAIEKALNERGDFPQLDEIAFSDSSKFLLKELDTKIAHDQIYTSLDNIFKYTQTDNIDDANIILNNLHRDLNVELFQIGNSAIIKYDNRPQDCNPTNEQLVPAEMDNNLIKNRMIFESSLERMGKLFGIKVNTITNEELSQSQFDGVADAKSANAFIYNGEIYLNTDVADVKESKIHELLHVFLGGVRFNNPDLYFSLVQSVETLKDYNLLASQYLNRTQGDVDEEIFVQQFAKYLSGYPTIFNMMDPKLLNTLMYEMQRNIDSFIDGKYSVRALPLNQVFNSSILSLVDQLGSHISQMSYPAILEEAQIHRILANTKEDLMSKNELIQECS